MGPLVDKDQAPPILLPGGQLSSAVDMDYALYTLPFHALYDKK